MGAYEFSVSLRIRHPDIDPALITGTLGITPQHTWQAGAPRRDPTGGDLVGVYRESYWTGRLMEEPRVSSEQTSVETVLIETVSMLRRSQAFLEQLSAEGGVAQLTVSLFARENFALELAAETVAALNRLRLALTIDVQTHSNPKTHSPRAN